MKRLQPVAFAFAALLVSLPVFAGEWPAGVRETFRDGCVNSAAQALGEARARTYCDCTLAHIARDFTTAEIAALQKADLPEPLIRRLQQVSQQCLAEE